MRSGKEIDAEYLGAELSQFKNQTREFLLSEMRGYRVIQKELPAGIILLTTAKLSGNYHARSESGVSVLALGHWKRNMAPP
jgi:hypothetical protein